MSLTVTFPTEIEPVLRERAAAVGTDVESFVRQIVIEEVAETHASPIRSESHGQFMARLKGIIQRHGVSHGHFDDSRESIYAGRGE